MNLSRTQIRAIIADRFDSWRRYLDEQNATPIMCLGMNHPENQLVITTTGEMTRERTIEMLLATVALLRQGYREVQPRPDGESGIVESYT